MPRRKKTEDDEETNCRIGDVVARLRRERGWKLEVVARGLERSTSYVSALETGQYTFSAAMLERLARLFQRPPSIFLRADIVPDALTQEWSQIFAPLSARDRVVLVDLAKKLSSWSSTLTQARQARDARAPHRAGRLISLEGIDGSHLETLGATLAARSGGLVVHCPHNYRGPLWQHMIEHFARLDEKQIEQIEHRALERTLLFACERLLRYEEQVAPALKADKIVVAPFFSMASSVYQETEGVGDRRIIDIVESLLPKPDAIVMLRSDPKRAAQKAVPGIPGPGQFYSPYRRDQLIIAKRLYEKAVEEFDARAMPVYVYNVATRLSRSSVDAIYSRIVRARAK